jgi:alkylation response protein AidB-like acyl-CoA dehydrogenase
MHGGLGYSTDLPFERIYRDYRGAQIYEGATEIHKFLIARMLLEQRLGQRII